MLMSLEVNIYIYPKFMTKIIENCIEILFSLVILGQLGMHIRMRFNHIL